MTEAEKLIKIAENSQLIANTNAELEEALYSKSTGGKSWYDKFWDSFQTNGTRVNYNRAFYGWRLDCFCPKYDLIPTNADYMFNDTFLGDKPYPSLKTALAKLGVSFDTSQCTSFSYTFYYSWISEIGIIDTRASANLNTLFIWASKTHTIEKLILKDDGSQTLKNTFDGANVLANIVIEGVIGSSVNFKSCPLSKDSITSVVNALSSSASGQTATFKQTAKEAAFTTEEWSTLIGTKSNWTISLV